MAWNIHWQCCFQSFGGTQYAVNIYEMNYVGDIIQLTGAAEPFETQEDDDDDIFKPIRTQTGYLRVIDYDGTLLQQIIPSNNTEKLVRLLVGTHSNGSFVPAQTNSIKWQGFLCADAYTQPWDGQANMVEFPVKSFLAALEDVNISNELAGSIQRFAGLFYYGFMSLTIDEAPYTSIESISDLGNTSNWMKMFVEWGIFFDEETSNEQDESYSILVGHSYYDIISAFCTTFGLIARECGDVLCFAMYDSGKYKIGTSTLTWNQIENYVINHINFYDNTNDIQDIEMFPSAGSSPLTFMGSENTVTYKIGARSAKVVLSLKDMNKLIGLPGVVADESTVYEVSLVNNASGSTSADNWTAYLQPHSPRSNAIETYGFNRCSISELSYQEDEGWGVVNTYIYWYYTQVEISSYSDFLAHSLIISPLECNVSGGSIYTGACPVRWFMQQHGDSVLLKDGLFLTLKTLTYFVGNVRPQQTGYNIAYKIQTDAPFALANGMLNIDMCCRTVVRSVNNTSWLYPAKGGVVFGIQFGNKYWDGTNWTSDISTPKTFLIEFNDDGSVFTNKTSSMNVNKTDGYFIPVDTAMSGKITLIIYDSGYNNILPISFVRPQDARARIIYDLNVEFLYYNDIAASGRSENKYYRKIVLSGFSDEKEINLRIGTFNNNLISPVFLREILNAEEYVQSVDYLTSDEYHPAEERPEVHLLNRLEAYYKIVRKSFSATISAGLDIIRKRYTYLNSAFFAVDAKHNWVDDTQDVKFIEVTKDNS